MKVLIISGSPNKDGLTEACARAAELGTHEAGSEFTSVRLNDLNISNCHACNNGFGTCKGKNSCQVEDDFQELHKLVGEMDAYIVITPVYWGDMSESSKTFFDRLRRCEAYNKGKNDFEGKPVICIAAAGGSGNGTITCLSSMERLFTHMRAEKFDFISITKKTRNFKLETVRLSVEEMVSYLNKNPV